MVLLVQYYDSTRKKHDKSPIPWYPVMASFSLPTSNILHILLLYILGIVFHIQKRKYSYIIILTSFSIPFMILRVSYYIPSLSLCSSFTSYLVPFMNKVSIHIRSLESTVTSQFELHYSSIIKP